MICDYSAFRLKIAASLGFETCLLAKDNFQEHALRYFGTALSLNGPTADIDCFLDAAGADSILTDFMQYGKIESRFVAVAVNNKPRSIDLLYLTYAQKSLIGSGGYAPEDVIDVQKIFASKRWPIEQIITHEFPIEDLVKAIIIAGDVNHALNVVIKFK